MTELIYLKDSYLYDYQDSKIIDLWENDFWKYIVLDKTIFYPQGWWQPSDTWVISSKKWRFLVKKASIIDAVVYHYWDFDYGDFEIWDNIYLKIDKEKRFINAKNHSAWHLIDVAMKNIWFWYLNPTKWYHFPEWCYVEYEWDFYEDKDDFISKLNIELGNLIKKDIKVVIKEGLSWIKSPIWKKSRFVNFDWYDGCWCGWTHIKSSKELGEIFIRKIKYKKWVLKISYEVL